MSKSIILQRLSELNTWNEDHYNEILELQAELDYLDSLDNDDDMDFALSEYDDK